MRYLIKYATRGRANQFKKAIANIYDTITTNDFLILVSIDFDDNDMNNPSMISFLNGCRNLNYYWGVKYSKISAINRDMEHSGEWDILINMSDDMEFVQIGWDKIIESDIKESFGETTDFFAHYNDGYVGIALPTMSIMGRLYYERDWYIYCPAYKSFSSDAEAMYVAQMRGKHKYFDKVLFKHQHPTWMGTPNDETYRVNSLATEHDIKVYWHRLNNYFFEPYSENTDIPYKQFIGRTR